MKAYVFTDASLERQAGRYVWLSMDIESAESAPFLSKHSVPAIPTYFVIDSESEQALIRWTGGTSVDGLHALLEEGTLAHGGERDEALVRADEFYAKGDYEQAATLYGEVLAGIDSDAPHSGRTVESLMFALQMSKQYEDGVALARDHYANLGPSSSGGNIAASALNCALSLPADHPERPMWAAEWEKTTLMIVQDESVPMAPDDRSGMYGVLVWAREDAGDEKGHKMVANLWADFLERAAAAAPTPEARSTYDSHYISACIEAGDPARAVPHLEQSQRDFPDDYNPPARLAIAYKYMEEWDKGIAASQLALARAYGPRKLLVWRYLADLYVGKGDVAAAKSTLEEAIEYAKMLPEGQYRESRIAPLQKKLEDLS
jgi:tetratricopeptide (TPR) repeat protein